MVSFSEEGEREKKKEKWGYLLGAIYRYVKCLARHGKRWVTLSDLGCPRGVMVIAMNCGFVVREFVLQSRYYVHFRANTLGKGMNPLILPPAMDK